MSKDVFVDLPQGFVGNPTVTPLCTSKDFETTPASFAFGNGASRPESTQVGISGVDVRGSGYPAYVWMPTYNLVPPAGVSAQFGLSPLGNPVIFRLTVRTASDYGLTIAAKNLTQARQVTGVLTTFWGVPADHSHDQLRGECMETFNEYLPYPKSAQVESPAGSGEFVDESCPTDSSEQPFLTLPEDCSGPLKVVFHADSWQHPGTYKPDGSPDYSDPNWANAEARMPALHGCGRSAFAPTLTAAPDTTAADSPAGFTVDVKDAQDGLLNSSSVAGPPIRETTLTFPAGVAINPGLAAGLQACQPSEDGSGSEAQPSCPAGSRVGTVQITSPLLSDPLEGSVYFLQSSPPDIQLLIAASGDGVNVKLKADVHLDEATGRPTITLVNLPPLPVSDFRLAFTGGPQAALVTPATCGSYATSGLFVPSSTPFVSSFPYSSTLGISTGPGGSACASPLPFVPAMTAGSTTDQAGGYTNFTLLLQRSDGQQRISSLQFKTPPGLDAIIKGVPLCPEPQAAQGTCPAASQIGHAIVTAGPGPAPLVIPNQGSPQRRST